MTTRPEGTPASLAQQVIDLHVVSGLTASQTARLLGAPPRLVGDWITGAASATPDQEKRLREMLLLVRELPAGTPEERRAHLLDSSNSASLFHSLLPLTQCECVQAAALSVSERLAV